MYVSFCVPFFVSLKPLEEPCRKKIKGICGRVIYMQRMYGVLAAATELAVFVGGGILVLLAVGWLL